MVQKKLPLNLLAVILSLLDNGKTFICCNLFSAVAQIFETRAVLLLVRGCLNIETNATEFVNV